MKRSVGFWMVTALVLGLLTLGTGLPVYAQDPVVEEIPPGPETDLPDYIGGPAKPHPSPNSGVPQNPLLWPNPFNMGNCSAC